MHQEPHGRKNVVVLKYEDDDDDLTVLVHPVDFLYGRQLLNRFRELPLPIEALRHRVPHDAVVLLKNRVHGKHPRPVAANPENVHQINGELVGLAHRVGGLLFESVNRANARHDAVAHVHEHGTGEEKGPNVQTRHNAHQVNDDRMVGALFRGAKKVVPPKEEQRVRGTAPSVEQKEAKVFEVARAHAIVHPRTVVIHPGNAPIANATVV